MSKVFDLIKEQAIEAQQINGPENVAIFIAGPIDEDYDPKVDNHHWEIATLVDVWVKGLIIDLNCCEIIEEDAKKIRDCHGWLSLDTDGREHTLGVLFVVFDGSPNAWVPITPTTLGSGEYLPFAVTFIGRNEDRDFQNVITQWHEELLKFVIPGSGGL